MILNIGTNGPVRVVTDDFIGPVTSLGPIACTEGLGVCDFLSPPALKMGHLVTVAT